MIHFMDFYYANALYLYKRLDGQGEKWRASGATIFWSGGLCMLALNVVQLFTGSLAPLVRAAVPAANKPYNNAAEYLIAIPFALVLHYYWFWERTPFLLKKYASLERTHKRWLAGFSYLWGILFVVACGYGRVNFWLSLLFAAVIFFSQEVFYKYLAGRFIRFP